MSTFKLAKLVRDNIVDQQIALGQKPSYHHLNNKEHKQALVKKVIEEVQEVLRAKAEDITSELADVQQALDDLIAEHGLTASEIATSQDSKKAAKGGFNKGVYVETLELSKDDPWVAYYRQDPKRFPEIN
jgi:predicted house-cleaning noncanonical NTP pyrophosphatase (MazG superfamily)